MSLRCSRTGRSLKFAGLVLGAVLMHRAEAAPAIKVCIDESNPAKAIDLGVVRAALKTQGYDAQQVPFTGHGKGEDDAFPVRRFAKLAQTECQLIMGFPVDVSSPHLPPDTLSTVAYASTGFVLVNSGKVGMKALEDLPYGSEVGIAQLDTWAGTLFSTHPNIVMHVYREDAEMLADLQHHRIAAGMTWQPFLQAYEMAHASGRHLNASMLPGKHMLWNLVALYVGQSSDAAAIFAKGIDSLRSSGELKHLIDPYRTAAMSQDSPQAAIDSSAARSSRARGACAQTAAPVKPAGRSTKPPALYTDAQAKRGAISYFQNCAMCHSPLLDGQKGGYSGPALKGADFADPSYDFHVDEIFNFVAKQMPAATPGSLPHDQDADIMAYILQQNGYPAGAVELSYEIAEKSKVPIRYYGKR